MNPPPFLLSSTLLFWGWQSHLLLFAIPMAVVLETPRWLKWRLALSDKDFNRLADLSSLLWVAAAAYLFFSQSIQGLFTLLSWLPILLLPLILAQNYSHQGAIKLSALFVSLRNAGNNEEIAQQRVNISYPYLLVCLLSASIGYTPGFFTGSFLLIIWGLWTIRPQRYPMRVWVPILILTGSLGYAGQIGLHQLQLQIEELVMEWLESVMWPDKDPYRRDTAIGDVGELKFSNRIILRVATPHPLLLREASYNSYFRGVWRAREVEFTTVPMGRHQNDSWLFAPLPPQTEMVRITKSLQEGKGLLPLPNGTYRITDLAVLNMQRNAFGVLKVEEGPEFINYYAHYGEPTPLDSPPTEQDLEIPREEELTFTELAKNLDLLNQPPPQILETVTTFFNSQFSYSLELAKARLNNSPLSDFLYQRRVGHCEYFATTTVLLLRAAGIPARYASGYAVEEFSIWEGLYVVRKRHAHAWTLFYLEGRWQTLDTTPVSWTSIEAEASHWWQFIPDLWSWMIHQFNQWRWRETDHSHQWLAWILLPLSILLAWRLYSKEKIKRSVKTSIKASPLYKGADSAFYQIIQRLIAAGYIRLTGETVSTWFNRLQIDAVVNEEMKIMLALHQRYRFDPLNTGTQEQLLLKQQVEQWLQKYSQSLKLPK